MGQLVKPKVFFVGATEVDESGLKEYLEYTKQMEFWPVYEQARLDGLKSGEALCSVFAKMCYKSLVLGKNSNVSKVRDVWKNLEGCHDTGHGCYDADTDVLTSVGWKSWPEVTTDDLLASLDKGGKLVYVKPVDVRSFAYSGRMYRVESQGVDLLVTPNHKMYVCPTTTRLGRKRDFFSLTEAQQLGTISHAYTKVAEAWEPREAYPYSVNLLRFLGFAIGDGNYEGGFRVRFRLRRPRKVAWLKQVVKALAVEQAGQWGIEFDGKDRYTVKIAESATDTVKRMYRDGEKCIPQHILMTAGQEQLEGLLEGLMQSDGHEGSTGDSFDTTSPVLADQIQQLCLHCGIAANVCYTYDTADRPTSFGTKPLTRLSVLSRNLKPEVNRHAEQEGKSYWIEDWSGEVFCAQMPGDTRHVLYVRRNGKPVWCGNSVFEHCQLNFIVTDCSRVYTHEQVRHRIGWAYSQTSGRYCRLDKIDLVWSGLLDPVKDLWEKHLLATEDLVYLTECKLGLRKPPPGFESYNPEWWINVRDSRLPENRDEGKWVPDDAFNFDKRKAITSAIRRIAPNGQSNEIGMSCNIRSLRSTVQVRTARFAETEIRDIFNQVYTLVKARFPTIFYKARTKTFDGLLEVFGMKTQPFELTAGDPAALEFLPSALLRSELAARDAGDVPTAG